MTVTSQIDYAALNQPLGSLPKVGTKTIEALNRLGIYRPLDLLFHLPSGVSTHRVITKPTLLAPGESVVFPCTCVKHPKISHVTPRRIPAKIVTQTPLGTVNLVFFNGFHAYLKNQFPLNKTLAVAGIPELSNGVWQIIHPTVMPLDSLKRTTVHETIYPLTHGLRMNLLRDLIQHVLKAIPPIFEWLDPEFLRRQGWPTYGNALHHLHNPGIHTPHPRDSSDDTSCALQSPARLRVAFDEAFVYQKRIATLRADARNVSGFAFATNHTMHEAFLSQLPFRLTACQTNAIAEIHQDMAAVQPMRRLLHGDVGSGKTAVAAAAMLQALANGKSAAVLAPTEILTKQHHATLTEWFRELGIAVHCMTTNTSKSQREAALCAIHSDPTRTILVGTHALLYDDRFARHLGIVIIDEQHRFGVHQRQKLLILTPAPDLLMMSATPIPRTMLLTLFGDLAVSALKTKPAGRPDIITRVMANGRIHTIIEKLTGVIASGEKVFWVCPLIEESEHLNAIDAETRFNVLRENLGANAVGLIHGRMKPEEKDAVFASFKKGTIRVLVATSVIEVGVDVPDATILIIENAERFGLAQLHQLRGRVGRSNKAASCTLLYGDAISDKGLTRLQLMRACHDGFILAEEDLKLRQGGDIIGRQQSGEITFKTLDLDAHIELMFLAREMTPNLHPPKNMLALWCAKSPENETKILGI